MDRACFFCNIGNYSIPPWLHPRHSGCNRLSLVCSRRQAAPSGDLPIPAHIHERLYELESMNSSLQQQLAVLRQGSSDSSMAAAGIQGQLEELQQVTAEGNVAVCAPPSTNKCGVVCHAVSRVSAQGYVPADGGCPSAMAVCLSCLPCCLQRGVLHIWKLSASCNPEHLVCHCR
jgi:hypothetical protein